MHLFKIQISAIWFDFTIVTADVITFHIVYWSFPSPQAKFVEYLRFTNCYRKGNKKRKSRHSETWLDMDCLLVSQWGTFFYLHAAIFEIPKKYFKIKPPAGWGAEASIEIYQLLLLFSIITSRSMSAAVIHWGYLSV